MNNKQFVIQMLKKGLNEEITPIQTSGDPIGYTCKLSERIGRLKATIQGAINVLEG